MIQLSTHSDAFSDDLDGRALVTDYGQFGKRRRPLPDYWSAAVDDFGGPASPIPTTGSGSFLFRANMRFAFPRF